MLLTMIATITSPLNIYSNQTTQTALPNILWTIFMAYKLISVAVKLAFYLTDTRDTLSSELL